MNLRHDHFSSVVQARRVVAQSSRSQTSRADHSGSAAHVLRSSQEHFGCHTRHARLFSKPGQISVDGQGTAAGHTFTPDHTIRDSQEGPVRRYLQHGQMADGIHRMLAVRPLQPTQVTHGPHARFGWHSFDAANDDSTPSQASPRTTYGQPMQPSVPTLLAAGLIFKPRPTGVRVPYVTRRGDIFRGPFNDRFPWIERSRLLYRASQNLPERLLQRACAHLPLVPDQHDQEDRWTNT